MTRILLSDCRGAPYTRPPSGRLLDDTIVAPG